MPLTAQRTTQAGRLRKRLPLLAACTLMAGALAACSSASADSDVSEDGRLAFGCSVTQHIHEEHDTPDSWSPFLGDDADPAVRETATVGSIFMAAKDAGLAADDPLVQVGEDLLTGVSRADTGALTTGLEEAQEGCDDLGVDQDVEVSHESQLDYACSLADHIEEEYGAAAEWAGTADTPAWNLAVPLGAASGACNGQIRADDAEGSAAGLDLASGLCRVDAEAPEEALADVQAACSAR